MSELSDKSPFPEEGPNEYSNKLTGDDGWWMYAADKSRIYPQRSVVLLEWDGFKASFREAYFLRNGCNRNVYNRYYGQFDVMDAHAPITACSTQVFFSVEQAKEYAKGQVARLARVWGVLD